MNRVIIVAALCLPLLDNALNAQDGTLSEKTHPKVKLDLFRTAEKYCESRSDGTVLHIEAQLVFTNQSDEPLILFKGSHTIKSITVSGSPEALEARQYELESSYATAMEIPPVLRGEPMTFDSSFAILKPGESYVTQSLVLIPYNLTESDRPGVMPGSHFAVIEIYTWPHTDRLAIEFRERWRKKGTLVFMPILSVPFAIRVEVNPKTIPCQ